MRAKAPHNKKPKRIGRGRASGQGKTAGKGHKGQRSRSGFSQRIGFEGGQNPLYRRLPKRGFSRQYFRKDLPIVINIGRLDQVGVEEITPEILVEKGIIQKKALANGIKVLGKGELKSKLTIKAHAFSESAKAKIEEKGGQAVLLAEATEEK